jgi:4-amino-4-deoxy-L-arabinose transferase-like glycosyltransferase
MRSLDAAAQDTRTAPSFALCLAILAALTLLRLTGLTFSVVDLYFDESQYWAWSRELSFGYFSKPPLLAWAIALAEGACGSGEACVRAPAPLFYFGTSLVTYAIARELYDARVAFWAALTVAFSTGVVFSARIISTDVPLLFFWALALLAYVRLLRRPDWRWAVVLGVALGLGLLAKYAMIYFLLCVAIAAIVDRETRELLRTPLPWIALLIAALLIAPNLWWNIEHGFATFRHVGENIQGPGPRLQPLKALEFLATQFAVFGPISFAALLFAAARMRAAGSADRLMLAFALPVLVLITVSAFFRSAHPNWAGTAFVSGAVVAAAVLVRYQAWRLLGAGIAIGVAAQLVLLFTDARADRISLPLLRKADIYEPTLGWRALGGQAQQLAKRAGARTIAAERRYDVASLIYYARAFDGRVLAWPQGEIPSHHFELTRPLTAGAAEPILFVSLCPATARLAEFYANVEPLGGFDARTGPTTKRTYFAFRLSGRKKAIAPLGPCLRALAHRL